MKKKKTDNPVFAMVDARESRKLSRRFGIGCQDPCELYVFKKDEEMSKIHAQLSASKLHDELRPFIGPVIKPVKKPSAAKLAKEHGKLGAVGRFDSSDSEAYKTFRQLALEFRKDVAFGAALG